MRAKNRLKPRDKVATDERWWAEWPTLALLVVCYSVWVLATTLLSDLWLPIGMVLTTVMAALHSSLSHEVLHGHPTRFSLLNMALVFPPLTVAVPYLRFRDTHLAHHNDEILTDPYDDPETNYLDPVVWHSLPKWWRGILSFNNTLFGRLPGIGRS
jgi:fatty acid desaturase